MSKKHMGSSIDDFLVPGLGDEQARPRIGVEVLGVHGEPADQDQRPAALVRRSTGCACAPARASCLARCSPPCRCSGRWRARSATA